MRILLLHPEDSPRRGPWARQRWDQIVDLGKSSAATAAAWQVLTGAPVLRLQAFRRSLEDPRTAGEILRAGFGQLLDTCGLDWWELTSLFVHAELETALALRHLVAGADLSGDLFSTRPDWPVNGLVNFLGRNVESFSQTGRDSVAGRLRRYKNAFSRLSRTQVVDVLWDKYDADYTLRSRLSHRPQPLAGPVVLLPSAYTNVSRMAAAYASLVPEQQFLLVATRRSGLQFDRPANVVAAELAAYAEAGKRAAETATLIRDWDTLRAKLRRTAELELLDRTGVLDPFAKWFADGLAVRDAWQHVLARGPVSAVLCGDDSNWYTRLPVVLARKRGLPTIDFHHGAFDGRYLLKSPPSDFYLAKSEMERDYLLRVCQFPPERVIVGAPTASPSGATMDQRRSSSTILFFSEPIESVGGRTEEIYRELLPALVRMADQHGRTLTVKLHPFENLKTQARLLASVLGPEVVSRLHLVSGPLSAELLESAWFGITVESTTVVDCARHGVPCFLCEWLVSTPFGYVEQYARFGIGRRLLSLGDLEQIPRILSEVSEPPPVTGGVGPQIDPGVLRALFAGRTVATAK